MSANTERTEFEAWAVAILGDTATWRESGDCELAWQAWQAALSSLPIPPEGWKLVPIHATYAMGRAAQSYGPYPFETYQKMVEAAPPPPQVVVQPTAGISQVGATLCSVATCEQSLCMQTNRCHWDHYHPQGAADGRQVLLDKISDLERRVRYQRMALGRRDKESRRDAAQHTEEPKP